MRITLMPPANIAAWMVLIASPVLAAQGSGDVSNPLFESRSSHPVVDSLDVWRLDSGPIDPDNYFGETVANGMIGVKSSPHPFQAAGVLIQGVYDRGPENWDVILSVFNVAQMALAIDGVAITDAQQVSGLRQTLDLKHAALTTTFDYDGRASVRYTWYALRQLPYTALVDVTVTARQPIEITPTVGPEAPAGALDLEFIDRSFRDQNTPALPLAIVTATARSPSGRLQLAASHAFLLDGTAGQPEVQHTIDDEGGQHRITFTKRLEAGETYRFATLGTTMTSEQTSNPRNDADRITIVAALTGRDRLLEQHRRAWEELWRSDIVVEGDDETQRDVHAMLYHLYAFTRDDAPIGLAPMGLSGTGYHGHVFWDSETWMFPVLLALQPDIAASLLEYRYERLEAARRHAFARGYRGAMFPWESSGSGHEDTPVTPHCCLTGVMQDHITADIGIAAWQYFQVTKDLEWLRERGWPLLEATAQFWASRVERNGPGRYDIRNVVGAAEDQKNVDNEAYTNAAARQNLDAAIKAAIALGREPDPDWATVRDNIPILRFPDGLVQANSMYRDRAQTLPEVLFLAYPLTAMTDPAEIERHLAASRESKQPGLAGSVGMTLNARLGRPDEAYDLFKAGVQALQRPPFGVLAEHTTSRDVYFATGAGGLLQVMLYGFGGLHITDQGLEHRPGRLPRAWESLTLTGVGPERRTLVIDRAMDEAEAPMNASFPGGPGARPMLDPLFQDHAVVQRGKPLRVWGSASPGDEVRVTFAAGATSTARADDTGRWMATLPAVEAGGPHTLSVRTSSGASQTVEDILVGDVWLCSGQSNMQLEVKHTLDAWAEVLNSANDSIRLFSVPRATRVSAADSFSGPVQWQPAMPSSVADFSATCFYFARELQKTVRVPMGLVHSSWGGTRIEEWMSEAALRSTGRYEAALDILRLYEADPETAAARWSGLPHDRAPHRDCGVGNAEPPPPPRPPWEPGSSLTVMYNAMIAPLGSYAFRGVVWYQGESNTHDPANYQSLLAGLMGNWRDQFGEELPFLIVQLANHRPPAVEPCESGWAGVREAQRLAVANDPRAGLAVTIDIGDRYDIHPPNKQEVGRRLARSARHAVYGESIAPSGPVAREARREGDAVIVEFDDVEDELVALSSSYPIGFELCGAEPASCEYAVATIHGKRVALDPPPGTTPSRVRFCWADSPVCTLYDRSGLPAGPFEIAIDEP